MSDINFEKFKQTWEEVILSLKGKPLNDKAVNNLRTRFEISTNDLLFATDEEVYTWEKENELSLLKSELETTLETARMKDKSETRKLHIKLVDFLSKILGKVGK